MSRRGTCVDCDGTVEITEHGTCATCGSKSVMKIQYNRASNANVPVIGMGEVLAAVEALMTKIGHEEASAVEQAALQFISARLARMQGMSLGQHLENTLSMWELCTEVEEVEVEGKEGN